MHARKTPATVWLCCLEGVSADASLLVHVLHACLQGRLEVPIGQKPRTPFARLLYMAVHQAAQAGQGGEPCRELHSLLVAVNDILLLQMQASGLDAADPGVVSWNPGGCCFGWGRGSAGGSCLPLEIARTRLWSKIK